MTKNTIPPLSMKDGESRDLVAENITTLQTLFPEVVTEGKGGKSIDFEALRAILGDAVEEGKERYSFTWNGKAAARRFALTPSTATLRPCPEESVNWDSTQHLYIEGDNLEALKVLQKSYFNKIKMIYIDPPYNTGKDFIYPDNYTDSLKNYLELTGQVDDEGRKMQANTESNGRYHTDWLNMIYPRLVLARTLLAEDGVIFISIDDHEVHNLRKVCDEIFGEENFVGKIVWKNATDNNPTNIAIEHEYILCYAKEKQYILSEWKTTINAVKEKIIEEEQVLIKTHKNIESLQEEYGSWFKDNKHHLWPLDRYKYIDFGGVYIGSQSVHNPGKEGYRYDIIHPKTQKACKQPLLGYRFPKETMESLISEGKVLFGEDENKIVELKVYAKDYKAKLASVIELDGRSGPYDLKDLFGADVKVFTNPKPKLLLKDLITYTCDNNSIVLDFFSGSATMAHAVLELNKQDQGNRRFIMVQLPQPTKNGDFPTLAEIGKERIRRVIKKIQGEAQAPAQASLLGTVPQPPQDLGFRVYKLDSSNLHPWDAESFRQSKDLFAGVDNIKHDRNDDDIRTEILLKYGHDLALPCRKETVSGVDLYIYGAGLLVLCLQRRVATEKLLAVAEHLVALRQKQDMEEMRVLFRDNTFTDDVAKANVMQILTSGKIMDVRSL